MSIELYKEQIYKTAARAWKAHLGDIGEEGINKLIDSGIFNRGKELQGLKKGTNKILGANNAKMYRNLSHASSQAAIGYSNQALKNSGIRLTNELVDSIKRGLDNAYLYSTPGNAGYRYTGGVAHVPKDPTKKYPQHIKENMFSFIPDDKMPDIVPNIQRKDRDSKKWIQAIMDRHEADEIRYGNALLKNKKNIKVNEGGLNDFITKFHSHTTPKVLMRESANIALAPENAQKYLLKARSDFGANLQLNNLKKLTDGHDYGKNGVYDRIKANIAERRRIKYNRENPDAWL